MTADTDTTVVFDTTAANAPKPAYSKSALARMAKSDDWCESKA